MILQNPLDTVRDSPGVDRLRLRKRLEFSDVDTAVAVNVGSGVEVGHGQLHWIELPVARQLRSDATDKLNASDKLKEDTPFPRCPFRSEQPSDHGYHRSQTRMQEASKAKTVTTTARLTGFEDKKDTHGCLLSSCAGS